jgi:hypothetical protein
MALRFGGFYGQAESAVQMINNPSSWVSYLYKYYYLETSPLLIIVIGACELALSLMFIVGMYRNLVYGTALLFQLSITIAEQDDLSAFLSNPSFFSTVPLIFAFIALFVMRHHDTKWTLTKKPAMFS